MKTIPQAVLDNAKELIESFGEHFIIRGLYQGKQVYQFVFPKETATGFPFVFLYDGLTNEVESITGIGAIQLLTSL